MYSDSRGHKILQFYVVPIIEQNRRNLNVLVLKILAVALLLNYRFS